MTGAPQIVEARPLPPLVDILRLLAESAASSWSLHPLDLDEVVDPLQWFAENTGLLAVIGQDGVQAIIGAPFAWVRSPELPFDDSVGPIEPAAAEEPAPRRYRTPQSTIDAFWYVVSRDDPARLKCWLENHPEDARSLRKLMEVA